jgi:purine-cytosine permease-like protein
MAVRRTRLTTRGRILVVVLIAIAMIAVFALGVAVGGAMRKEPGQVTMLTGTADVHVVTITETAP